MSGDIKRQLRRLQDEVRLVGPEDEHQREEEHKRIRDEAEHVNRCRERGKAPLFDIAENGDVFCAYDGKPVTDSRQILAEEFYWQELEWGASPGLIHDEEAEAFYTPDGELAVSRTRFDLQHLLNR